VADWMIESKLPFIDTNFQKSNIIKYGLL
jgi:hypothetical protein